MQAPGTGILRLTEVPTENRRRALILLSLLPQKGSTLKLWSLLVLKCMLTRRAEESMGLLLGTVPVQGSCQSNFIQGQYAGEKKAILRLDGLLPSSNN